MIYTFTPNPTLDLGGMVSNLVPNEKTYVQYETRSPGGNAINAARIIKKLKLPVIVGGFLGGGVGSEVESLLIEEKIKCQFIPIQGHTRVNVTVSDFKTHLQTRLSFPGPKILSSETKKLLRWINSIPSPSLAIIGGSLPPGFSTTLLKQIIQAFNKRRIPCVVDTPGKILKDLIHTKPLFIKPNLMEFQDLTGTSVTSIQSVIEVAKTFSSNIPFICVSSVENGALLITRNKVWFGKIPPVQVKTTVGAGDSMVGAMTAQIWKKRKTNPSKSSNMSDIEDGGDLLRWGLAAATATLITTGTQLGNYNDIIHYYPKIMIKEIV